MNVKVMVVVASAIVAARAFAVDNVVTNTFKATLASNTPLTPYEWESSSIWQDEALGAPFGWGAKADMAKELPLECFYVFPEGGLRLSGLRLKRGFYLGDVSTGEYSDTARGSLTIDTYFPAGAYLYGNYHPISRTTSLREWVSSVQIAGRVIPGFEAPASVPKFDLTGTLIVRHDLFAESADPVRQGVISDFTQYSHTMGGSLIIAGPKGAAAKTSNWSQTAGSVFVKYSSSAHGIVPGMTVTGDGVPSGTFVRFVFPRSTWIALSNPIDNGKTKSSNSLQFGAISPSVVENYPTIVAGADSTARTIAIGRAQEADGARLLIGDYQDYPGNPSSGSSGCAWGISPSANYASLVPGDIVISKFTLKDKTARRSYVLNNVRLEFDCDLEEVTDENPDFHWSQTAGVDSRVTVADGKTVYFSNFHDLLGTIDKRGAGKLVLPLKNANLTGTVKVGAGEFEFRKTSAVDAATVLHLGRLELSANTVLTIPAVGLTVDTFVCEAGAVVRGGPLAVNTDSLSTMPVLSVTEGASFVTTRRPLTREAAVPSADRWLHLDASDATTLVTETEGERQRVVRWNDVSGGSINARPYSVPGFTNGSILMTNACNGLKAVDLGSVSWGAYGTTDGSLSGDGKARVMFFYDGDSRFNSNGRDEYIVNTAFFMVGSQGGGGTLLNSCGTSYTVSGLPHTGNPEKDTMISAEYASGWQNFTRARIDAGTIVFRENGEKAYPHEKKFSGGWDVIAYRSGAGAGVDNRKACGFGMTANGDGRASYEYDHTYGGLAYGEVILYSNQLDTAQIDYVEAYLMKKWKNVDTEGYGPLKVGTLTLDADSTVEVSGDKIVAANVAGSGTVTGDLAISENASLTAVVGSDGRVGALTVGGRLELPEVATVSFTGPIKPKRGTYNLYAAETVAGGVSRWTVVPYPDDNSAYQVFVAGGAVRLNVMPPGMVLVFR